MKSIFEPFRKPYKNMTEGKEFDTVSVFFNPVESYILLDFGHHNPRTAQDRLPSAKTA